MRVTSTLEHQRRYIRQTQLPNVGEYGQNLLKSARILVVGAGGIGAPVLTYLNAAGIGTLGVIDMDRVELSNLNRQTLFEEADIGRLKVDAARDRLEEQNPYSNILTHPYAVQAANAHSIMHGYDIIIDGSDDFSTRHTVNATCVALKKPLISASALGWNGQLASFDTRRDSSPCYQCLVHPNAANANTCEDAGIIGAVAGALGSMAALEAIHMVLGTPSLIGWLVLFDGKNFEQRKIRILQDEACSICMTRRRP